MWWFCHEVSLFWKIRFPFHARSFETTHRIKYVHITMVIVGLLLPALPVIVTFAAATRDSRGFGLIRFPPILCSGLESDATFYSFVLPINILLAIGIPLLIIIFWIIHKVILCTPNTMNHTFGWPQYFIFSWQNFSKWNQELMSATEWVSNYYTSLQSSQLWNSTGVKRKPFNCSFMLSITVTQDYIWCILW